MTKTLCKKHLPWDLNKITIQRNFLRQKSYKTNRTIPQNLKKEPYQKHHAETLTSTETLYDKNTMKWKPLSLSPNKILNQMNSFRQKHHMIKTLCNKNPYHWALTKSSIKWTLFGRNIIWLKPYAIKTLITEP